MSNPTGKGGFSERPQDINRTGANAKDKSWRGTVERITNQTREEAIKAVGARTRLGRLLKELPPNLPIKDALIYISIVHYGREPNPRMLQTLADREEGKPMQPLAHTGEVSIKGYGKWTPDDWDKDKDGD